MSLYNRNEWKEFRENVIESDGYKCNICGRKEGEVTLHVHHKSYIPGKLPWEYGLENCETLCRGCHVAEHGIIQPKIGWEYLGDEDLGDLIGECQNSGCGNAIRYVYLISHPKWGFLEVGTVCCDNLTDTNIASNKRENQNRYESRKTRFLKSQRWNIENRVHKIRQTLFAVEIEENNNGYYITIHKLRSKKNYQTLDEAKGVAFDALDSGDLFNYLDRHKISYRKKNNKKTLHNIK